MIIYSTGEGEVWKEARIPYKAAASLKRNPTPSALATCVPGGRRKTRGAVPERPMLAAEAKKEKGSRHKRKAKRKELNSFFLDTQDLLVILLLCSPLMPHPFYSETFLGVFLFRT